MRYEKLVSYRVLYRRIYYLYAVCRKRLSRFHV
nr:MAG TPA: hypothetical protein [Caudoviricetes sp.]